MADQRGEVVRKGAHCAWPIHYHMVFPVKYRKAVLDEAVTTIIQETAAEIAERFPIEMEAIGTDKNHIHLLGRDRKSTRLNSSHERLSRMPSSA